MYGSKYVWILLGFYQPGWHLIRDDPVLSCTPEEMTQATEGHLTTEIQMIDENLDASTYSGITPRQFKEKLLSDPNITWIPEASLSFDAVFSIAIALNKTARNLQLDEFNYGDQNMFKQLQGSLESVSFKGISGNVAFSATGDRVARAIVEQMQANNYVTLGFYSKSTDDFDWLGRDQWSTKHGRPPRDSIENQIERIQISRPLFRVVAALISLCFVFSMICLAFNIVHRNKRYIQLSHSNINNCTILGCCLSLVAVVIVGLELESRVYCPINVSLLALGFSLGYGSLFAKIYMVHYFSNRITKQATKVIQSWHLQSVILVFVLMDFITMLTCELVYPLHVEQFMYPSRPFDDDVIIQPVLKYCTSDQYLLLLGLLYGFKGIMLMLGLYLAYDTRSTVVREVNDLWYIQMSVYNIALLLCIIIPVCTIISAQPDASYALQSLAIIICTMLTLLLIFVPKIRELWKNPDGVIERKVTLLTQPAPPGGDKKTVLHNQLDSLTYDIAQKELLIAQLTKRLKTLTVEKGHRDPGVPPLAMPEPTFISCDSIYFDCELDRLVIQPNGRLTRQCNSATEKLNKSFRSSYV